MLFNLPTLTVRRLITHHRSIIITCWLSPCANMITKRRVMVCFMHALWLNYSFPTCGLLLKGCCCRTSCSLQGALGCWGQRLYPLQTLPTVKYAKQTEFGSSLQSVLLLFLLFPPCAKPRSRTPGQLELIRWSDWWAWNAAWAKGKRK